MPPTDDADFGPEPDAVKPDYSGLSISDMLTRLQRKHIENLLALAESNDLPNAQVLAQINRYLMDNGILVERSPAPEMKTIEGHPNRPALPDFTGQNYDE